MSSKNYIKEKDLKSGSVPIPIDILEIIIEQTKKCICKIEDNMKNGTGFFCLIPFPDKFHYLPVLISANHVLEKDDVAKGKKIKFTINNDKIYKEINIDESRKIFTNENYDITIVEIKKNDNLDFNSFLEIDENIYKKDLVDFYRQNSIYLIYYPHGNKASYSNGKIKNINLDLNGIEHLCSTKPGSSGCPMLNLNNNRVIGVHVSAHKFEDWNLGAFIKKPIEEFYEEYNNKVKKENNEKKENKFDESEYNNPKINKKEIFSNELEYNQGDKDLEPYFVPRAKNAGGKIQNHDVNKLKRALRMGILSCTGVRLYSALIGYDLKMREAAVCAFLEFIENPLPTRYLNKSLPLFLTCIEICKVTCYDKDDTIYMVGLRLLKVCLARPVCGKDIEPNFIQKSINYFLPIYIKRISEYNVNSKIRDLTLRTIIVIFGHPALNVGYLVKDCLDIVENNYKVTPDKQPWKALFARLEIILDILCEYGINENLWDWNQVFVKLIIPSLFHQKPECYFTAEEICVVLYKFIGNDIKKIINGLNHLELNIKERLNNKFKEIDNLINKES